MGSNKYPYKGVLDVIANRCMASGTNAWTDQDHTAYTITTVGSEGFFKVLPVYIDHLLCPMLTPSQFATEVHHIDGKGDDAGVVYCEMQDHESEMDSIIDRKIKDLTYPRNNPYAVDTGGRLKNLRESCNLEKVRAYHKKFYHLSNMIVTVCGKVDHDKLLNIVEQVEKEHIGTIPTSFPTPFSFQQPELKETTTTRVKCPSDDATRGNVEISWLAHSPTDLRTHTALQTLFDYFSNTAVSPLQTDFVLLDDPLASSAYFHIAEGIKCNMRLCFSGVPIEKLDHVAGRFFDKTVQEHLEDSKWDLERMGFLIDQSIQNELVTQETGIHKDIFGHVIGHQLFDKEDTELLKTRLNEIDMLKKLRSEPASFWSGLVKKYFTAPQVTVIGVPDEKLVDEIAKEEEGRLKKQRTNLGKEGLAKKGKEIADAIHQNTAKKPSDEVLDKLIVKNLENLDRFDVQSVTKTTPRLTEKQSRFLSQFNFHANLHHLNSNFVELFLLFDSTDLMPEDRALLELYTELLFESPAIVDGKLRTAEEISKLFTADLVDHSVEVGVSGFYDRLVSIRIKVSVDKYPMLSKWARIFTQGVVFDASRVRMAAQKMASEAQENKRNGATVAQTGIVSLVYTENSNARLYDEIVLEKLHEKLAKEASKSPETVIAKLEKVRTNLFANGVNAHFLCNVDLLDDAHLHDQQWAWATQDAKFGRGAPFQTSTGQDVDCQLGRQLVIGVGGSESSFIYQTALMDADWSTPEILVPTMLYTQYLSQCEGPLWRAIRGDGLAYGANIFVKPDRKQITLSLYRCAQPAAAYERTKEIVLQVLAEGKLNETEFEGAKRSLVCEMMGRERDVSASGKQSILSTFRHISPDFNMDLCRRIWVATEKDILEVGGPRVAKLFETFVRSIVVHPSKVKEIKKSFPGIEQATVASLQYSAKN